MLQPQQPQATPLTVHKIDADEDIMESDDDDDDAESDEDNRSNNNDNAESNNNELANSAASTDVDESDGNQGVRRLLRKQKGITKKYADYSLLMAERGARRGGHVGLSFARDVSSSWQRISAMQSSFPRSTGRSLRSGSPLCITR
jgi:hypothetical protein